VGRGAATLTTGYSPGLPETFDLFSRGYLLSDIDLKVQVDNLIRIGTALSSETDIDALLEMIVDESRRFTGADAGTLYSISEGGRFLDWKIAHNDTLGSRMGGTSGVPVALPPVPLIIDGQMNLQNVSAYVSNTGETVNIPDVYKAEGFDFSGPRRYDEATGYRSTSMLVVPLRNHEGDIIGVLQLLNAKQAGKVIPFSSDYEAFIVALASQAAVAITNARLIRDLSDLFDAFIETTAAAIDEKSPYTAGHVRRVAKLTMMIAESIDAADQGIWKYVHFSPEELKELRIAAWMHDVGKMTTPEFVVDKATKLETIYDRLETVRTRYEVFRRDAEIAALTKKLDLLRGPGLEEELRAIDQALEEERAELDQERDFIVACNTGGEFMEDEDLLRLQAIANKHFEMDGKSQPRLSENEIYNLSIRKGTLTREERQVINNHAAVSIKMLSQLPFSKDLRRVPEFAGAHHEKLNGEGYPFKLKAHQLPLQGRILAAADIFEALTASDRPYRKPMPLSQAMKIMGFMVKDGELDVKIIDLVKQNGILQKYAAEELRTEQLDVG
jgi:HD-GYP domain-containing protein (c-di-GMP phosphodiesterase class II)